ncbi:hypothetical protein V9T40_014856 [Parthenolecanium corni]|uniref:Uncharacterized protein n=1 Tax=Parthenolecanium corni TaxID=536013 RepID=A0AAN9XXA6_9HEMI
MAQFYGQTVYYKKSMNDERTLKILTLILLYSTKDTPALMIPYIVYRWFFTVMLAGLFVVSFMDVQSFVELTRAFSYIPTFTGFMNLFIPVALRLNCSVLVAILEFGVVEISLSRRIGIRLTRGTVEEWKWSGTEEDEKTKMPEKRLKMKKRLQYERCLSWSVLSSRHVVSIDPWPYYYQSPVGSE